MLLIEDNFGELFAVSNPGLLRKLRPPLESMIHCDSGARADQSFLRSAFLVSFIAMKD